MKWIYTSADVTYGRGHLTNSLRVTTVYYVWEEEQTAYVSQVVKNKNMTTISDSEQHRNAVSLQNILYLEPSKSEILRDEI